MDIQGKGLREKFYNELKSKLQKGDERGLITYAKPSNGETIKINGIVLYKILRIPNHWGKNGIAVHKKLTDIAIKAIEGKRSKDKKSWIGCALTEENYNRLMFILSDLGRKIFDAKKSKTMGKRIRKTISKIDPEITQEIKPPFKKKLFPRKKF